MKKEDFEKNHYIISNGKLHPASTPNYEDAIMLYKISGNHLDEIVRLSGNKKFYMGKKNEEGVRKDVYNEIEIACNPKNFFDTKNHHPLVYFDGTDTYITTNIFHYITHFSPSPYISSYGKPVSEIGQDTSPRW